MSAGTVPAAFRIDARDNVATALSDLPPGRVRLLGEAAGEEIEAAEPVPRGHKLALRDIAAGGDVVKYGVPIGRAFKPIARGGWVHLHCLESRFDEKSSQLDPATGVSRDTRY
ncbi:MAG: UxaA family hydrolase [Planctomycetota bacterium]|nr:UxaA family hydrolase [Planctomycetota bacterium]